MPPDERIDRSLLARRLNELGYERIRPRLPGSPGPLVAYALTFAVFDIVVLQGYQQLTGRVAVFLESPLWLLTPTAIVAAALATESLHDRYDLTVAHHLTRGHSDPPDRFTRLVPDWLALLFIAFGIVFTLLNALVIVGLGRIEAVEGIAGVVGFVVVIPFGYAPIAATFLATYASVEVLLPRRLEDADVGLYFLDPERLGGMRPVGELVKWAYYYVMLGLVVYAIATYGPHILGGALQYTAYEPPGTIVSATFTAIWILAVLTMVYGIHVLHRYMLGAKREELRRLDERVRAYVDDPMDVANYTVVADDASDFEELRSRMDDVASTREYPATFTMWSQVIVGVALPKALQLALSAL